MRDSCHWRAIRSGYSYYNEIGGSPVAKSATPWWRAENRLSVDRYQSPKNSTSMRVFKVLLVEDDAEAADIIIRYLSRYNFDVTHVDDGRMGLVKIKGDLFDLILCDIMMPGVDGFRFLDRAQEYIKGTPIIMTTALGDMRNVIEAAAHRVHSYLVKPIQHGTLIEKAVSALGIAQKDLIIRKEHPFQVRIEKINDDRLRILLKGIPAETAEASFLSAVRIWTDLRSAFIDFEIEREFIYSPASVNLLESFLLSTQRLLGSGPSRVTLSGPYFDLVAKNALMERRIISQCKGLPA